MKQVGDKADRARAIYYSGDVDDFAFKSFLRLVMNGRVEAGYVLGEILRSGDDQYIEEFFSMMKQIDEEGHDIVKESYEAKIKSGGFDD